MSIRFHCKRCRQLLGIASRKAGSEIQCPKCGFSQTVPALEAAAAALAMNQLAPTSQVVEDPSNIVVYDEDPAPTDVAPTPAAPEPSAAPPEPAGAASGELLRSELPPGPPTGQPVPHDMILFSRRTFYVHAILFVVLAVAAFGSGYLVGRGAAGFQHEVRQQEAAREQMVVEGTLVYDPGSGQPAPDENAVAMALPEGKLPEQPLSIQGIRPQDPPPPEDSPTLRRIRELGGDYVRADAEGKFNLVVPGQGRYYVLVVSAHAARPSGKQIDEADLAQIERYFQLGEHLVNRYKYRWTLEEIDAGFNPIEYDFGRNERS